MSTVINYFIETNLLILVLWLIYALAFSNENNFLFRRAYLHFTLLASLLVPLIKFPQNAVIPSMGALGEGWLLPELTVGETMEASTSTAVVQFGLVELVVTIYGLAVTILLGLFLLRVVRLYRFIKKHPTKMVDGAIVIETEKSVPVFSFFKYVVIGHAASFTREEKLQILLHELVHVRKLHSLDVVVASLIQAVFWFNPAVWMLGREFHTLHEYEADQEALEQTDRASYSSLLARMVLVSNGFALASHFNKSITLKRIQMIKEVKQSMARWKVALVVPVVALALFAVACQDQLNDMVSDSSMALDLPPRVQEQLTDFQKKNPGSKIVVLEQTQNWKEELESLKAQYGAEQLLGGTTIASEKELRYFVFFKWDDKTSQLAEQSATNEIFTIVEDPAAPVDGMTSFYEAVGREIQYTETARKQGIEGRVFVEFVVQEDGSLSNFKVLKGIDPALDQNAIEAIKRTHMEWKPGKQQGKAVKQRLVLPITFSLSQNGQAAKVRMESIQKSK
ncbi:MAG: TonB family protein [Cyclobacteriaceae bacterium]